MWKVHVLTWRPILSKAAIRARRAKEFVSKSTLISKNRHGATSRLSPRQTSRSDLQSSLDVYDSKQSRVRSVRQNLRKAAEGIVGKVHFGPYRAKLGNRAGEPS